MFDLISLLLASISFAAVPVPIIQVGDFDDNGSQDVRITTGSGNQTIKIQDDEVSGVRVSVDLNSDGDFTDTLEINNQVIGFVDTVSIVTGVGNDVVTVSLGTEGYFGFARKYIVDLGTGNDSFIFNDDNGGITSSTAVLEVYGGTGNDNLQANVASLVTSTAVVRFDGGTGNDNVIINASSTINNSSLDVRTLLGAGTNSFELEVTGALTGTTTSSIFCNVEGGKNDDTALFQFNDNINARCFVVLNATLGLGNDTARCELDTTGIDLFNDGGIAGGQLAIDFRGEDGNDSLAVTREFDGVLTSPSMNVEGPLDIHLSGGAGKDNLLVDLGGSNTLTQSETNSTRRGLFANLDGGDGDDTMSLQLSDGVGFTATYRAILLGGLGNDIFNPITIVSNGTPSYVLGPIEIDGGAGTDTATTSGNGQLRLRHIE